MKQARKFINQVALAGAKVAQKEAKALAHTNPISQRVYDEVENQLKKQKKKKNIIRSERKQMMIQAPAAMAVSAAGVTPLVSTQGETKIIKGQELIFSNIQATNVSWTYDSDGVLINPLEAIFPLLANEAQNYQLYRFTRLNMEYENTCSTDTAGQLFLGCLTDPSDPVPTGPEEATAIKNSVRGPVWAPENFNFPCDGMFRYINGTQLSDADLRNIFQFRAWFGILNGALNVPLGSIRISYTIELSKRIAGEETSLLDIRIPLGPAALINTAIELASRKSRGPRWYTFPTDSKLQFQAFGSYSMLIYLNSSVDENVYAAVYPGLVFYHVDGTVAVQNVLFQQGSTAPGSTNLRAAVLSLKVSLRRGDFLDLSSLLALTGNLEGILIIERN